MITKECHYCSLGYRKDTTIVTYIELCVREWYISCGVDYSCIVGVGVVTSHMTILHALT